MIFLCVVLCVFNRTVTGRNGAEGSEQHEGVAAGGGGGLAAGGGRRGRALRGGACVDRDVAVRPGFVHLVLEEEPLLALKLEGEAGRVG